MNNLLAPNLAAEALKREWDKIPEPTEEISFEMAQELGLIPRVPSRYTMFAMPFESQYGLEKRSRAAELGYRADDKRIREQFKVVVYQGRKLRVV